MATARNETTVTSAAAQAAQVGNDCTHISLWDAAVGGNLLGQKAITGNPAPLALGEKFEIAAGALVLTVTKAADATDEMARRAAAGQVAGGVWVQYHTGAPGAAGTDNVIGIARTSIPQAQWVVAA